MAETGLDAKSVSERGFQLSARGFEVLATSVPAPMSTRCHNANRLRDPGETGDKALLQQCFDGLRYTLASDLRM